MATLGHTTIDVTSEPATEPVTITEIMERLRVTDLQFDGEMRDLITAARRAVEHDSHRKLITQTVVLRYDEFPATAEFVLRIAPIISITSVAYTDTAGNAQTVTSTNYTEDLDSTPPRIRAIDGFTWPATDNIPNAVNVTISAGYGAASAVPVEAKLAIYEWAKLHWGECTGDRMRYENLINQLAWSGVWEAA